MRRFALGALLYDPQRFGFMMVGDFIDALGGYNEAELERVKAVAEIVRKSTTLLWNIQVTEESRLEPDKLWRFPWDKEEEIRADPVPEEVKKEIDKSHENILNSM
jgi:hypothetical protein